MTDFYKLEGRLATEHALLDDNGDDLGTPADWYRGRPVKKPQEKSPMDGLLARQICVMPDHAEILLTPEQRRHRDELERSILVFREKKNDLPEDEYYQQLEVLLLDYARTVIPNSNAPAASKGQE